MNNWFSLNKIDNSTYAIQENNHWLRTNCYLLLGEKYCALIDSGMGIGNLKNLVSSITTLPVLVISTHTHWDHIGGHGNFNEIMVHKNETAWLCSGKIVSLKFIKNFITTALIKPGTLPENFNIDNYKVFTGDPSRILYGDEIIDLGNRKLKIIHTPGHSPGHICIYDMEKGYLFSGDIIFNAPITAHYTGSDPIAYYESICKLEQISNITRILPGHYNINLTRKTLEKIREVVDILKNKNQLYRGSGKHLINNVSLEF